MATHLAEAVSDKIRHAASLYHRLVLVVGGPGTGKTGALRNIAKSVGVPVVNVNLELTRRMLDLTERQRPLHAQPLLERIVAEPEGDVVLLDNLEILFDITLRLDPLRLLQGLSRSRTVVAAWNGSIENGHLRYASPGHPEYRHYAMYGVLAVSAETAAR